jgi:hypothetical protein
MMDFMSIVEIVSGIWILIAVGMATLVLRDTGNRFH